MSGDLGTLVAAFNAMNAKTDRKVQTLVRATGQLGLGVMRTEVPVDTHTLQNSVRVVQVGPYEVTVGPTVDYAGYVAYGTRRQAPNPYDLRTIERVGPTFEANANALGGSITL